MSCPDRDEVLNQLAAAVAACLKAGLTDIPVLVQQIIDAAGPTNPLVDARPPVPHVTVTARRPRTSSSSIAMMEKRSR
jgi:hypothetical protein